MKVLVDTPIWSLAFRRSESKLNTNESALLNELKEIINEARAVLTGPIRQEILSGISNEKQFKSLKVKLSHFKDVPALTNDYELAAELYNTCRKKGIQGSHIDFLLCAVAVNNNFLIFTTDTDFKQYGKYCDFSLHSSRFS